MPKEVKEKSEKKEKYGFYKGYDLQWLKSEPEHPDYYLVKEYENKYGEVK